MGAMDTTERAPLEGITKETEESASLRRVESAAAALAVVACEIFRKRSELLLATLALRKAAELTDPGILHGRHHYGGKPRGGAAASLQK